MASEFWKAVDNHVKQGFLNDRIMELKKAIEVLESHNKWRKGGDVPQQSPHTITTAIETICNLKHLLDK